MIAALQGELDIATVDDVRDALQELRTAGWDDIVVDVGDVSFVDSQGLRLLMALDASARDEGWRLRLSGDCPSLARLLELTCLSSWFEYA